MLLGMCQGSLLAMWKKTAGNVAGRTSPYPNLHRVWLFARGLRCAVDGLDGIVENESDAMMG